MFVFYNEENLLNYQSVILTDLSTETARYNEFELVLPTDLDLSVTGDYILEVYEQTSAVNLDPEQADNLCETDKVLLIGTPTTEYFYSVN